MRLLNFSSIGGASGDMILAALVDLGVGPETLQAKIASLPIEPFVIEPEAVEAGGWTGTRLHVRIKPQDPSPHRHLSSIRELIADSALSDRTKALSIRVFERLATAEAAVHKTTAEKVHFHEVGAVDSLVDIVGACVARDLLNVDAVQVGPLPLGTGSTTCDHGPIPIPVPAVVELLKDHPVQQTDEPFELVTPTGAAVLTEWQAESRQLSATHHDVGTHPTNFRIVAVGNGFGQRTLNGRPNLLRAALLESAGEEPGELHDECCVLKCSIDDTVPELLGSLAQRLVDDGALDVFTTPAQMKKQRPGTLLTVLCRPDQRDGFVETIFRESTTFGIRESISRRTVLERRMVEVDTPYGAVHVKVGAWKGKDITRAPEHKDCVRCAEEHDVPVRLVYEEALRALP